MRKNILLAALLLAGRADAKKPVELRAYETVAELAHRDGFYWRSTTCWRNYGGHLCELCFSHPQHILGTATVWCGDKDPCEWGLSADDPRLRGHDFGWCEHH